MSITFVLNNKSSKSVSKKVYGVLDETGLLIDAPFASKNEAIETAKRIGGRARSLKITVEILPGRIY